MLSFGFKSVSADGSLFVSQERDIWVMVYADEILIWSNFPGGAPELEEHLERYVIQTRNLGPITKFLGMDFKKTSQRWFISNENFICGD